MICKQKKEGNIQCIKTEYILLYNKNTLIRAIFMLRKLNPLHISDIGLLIGASALSSMEEPCTEGSGSHNDLMVISGLPWKELHIPLQAEQIV